VLPFWVTYTIRRKVCLKVCVRSRLHAHVWGAEDRARAAPIRGLLCCVHAAARRCGRPHLPHAHHTRCFSLFRPLLFPRNFALLAGGHARFDERQRLSPLTPAPLASGALDAIDSVLCLADRAMASTRRIAAKHSRPMCVCCSHPSHLCSFFSGRCLTNRRITLLAIGSHRRAG
jgi:hypothetical protein